MDDHQSMSANCNGVSCQVQRVCPSIIAHQPTGAHTRPFSTGLAVAHAVSFSKHNEASQQVGSREHVLPELTIQVLVPMNVPHVFRAHIT
jgi:hypothetical protein